MENMTDIIWYETLDSTNNQAKRLLPELEGTTVIAAREQTSGRGQRGNVWKSEPGSNLTFSIIFKNGDGFLENIPADCQFVISEAVAVGVKDFLSAEGVSSGIKWPNDIYVADSKICGILIENSVNGRKLTGSIAGIGLNLNQKVFPPELPNPVSLSLLTGKEYVPEEVLCRLVAAILARMEEAVSYGPKLRRSYLDAMYRKDIPSRYTDFRNGREFTGTIRGISDNGMLLVELEDRTVEKFAFKEIGYIIS